MLGRWRRPGRSSHAGTEAAGTVDPNDVYRLHQALVGTWPADRAPTSDMTEYTERLVGYMRKSVREAKRHTSWLNPNDVYESALTAFVTGAIRRLAQASPEDPGILFLRRIAKIGVVNSLAQLVLKLGAPGVVDIYQGAELWDLNLVDPDNRRPVDFDRRQQMLDGMEPLLNKVAKGPPDAGGDVRPLLDDWPMGAIKLFVTAVGLRLLVRTRRCSYPADMSRSAKRCGEMSISAFRPRWLDARSTMC